MTSSSSQQQQQSLYHNKSVSSLETTTGRISGQKNTGASFQVIQHELIELYMMVKASRTSKEELLKDEIREAEK